MANGLAIRNVLHSAFSHAGQKCSATSLLLLEGEVYDDPDFKRALVEAAQSISVGSVWKLENKIGPLIRPPSGDLEMALITLDPGESWALTPRNLEDNACLWSPGIKWGVSPGSFTHLTEFFGPVLGVMRFERLPEAIALVHQTGYGLTSGLESLDDREQDEWRHSLRAGNLYLNRGTTGAVVLRQPFGGMGKSAFGPGLKAGGPNYIAQLMRFTERGHDESEITMAALLHGYRASREMEFGREHDHFHLVGQDNVRRYLPVREMLIRVHPADSRFDLFARAAAARVSGCSITVSVTTGFESAALTELQDETKGWALAIKFIEERDDELASRIALGETDRIRYAALDRVPESVRRSANEQAVFIADAPVLASGRVELIWYFEEQSISFDYHRYGNLGSRANHSLPNGVSTK